MFLNLKVILCERLEGTDRLRYLSIDLRVGKNLTSEQPQPINEKPNFLHLVVVALNRGLVLALAFVDFSLAKFLCQGYLQYG